MIRSADIWDLAMPLGLRLTRDARAVDASEDAMVVQSRDLDHRRVRSWDWRRDGVNAVELLRFEELMSTTAGCVPVDLWLPRRNSLVWTEEIVRGAAGNSPHYGWARDVAADTDLTESLIGGPGSSKFGALIETSASASAGGEIHQEVGRTPSREHQLTFSLYVAEATASTIRLELYDDAGTAVYADFTWTSSVLDASGASTGVTARVEAFNATWFRAIATVDLAATSELYPGGVLGVRIHATPGKIANEGHYIFGTQLVLGSEALAYRGVAGDRVSPCPVTIEAARFELNSNVSHSVQCRLVEFVE